MSLLLPVFIVGHLTTRDDAPAWTWAVTALALVPCLLFAVPWIARTQAAPDRLPIDWGDKFWILLGLVIGGLVVIAPAAIIDGQPVWYGMLILAVGCLLLGLLIRHIRKPVRPPQPPPTDWGQPAGKGWRMFR